MWPGTQRKCLYATLEVNFQVMATVKIISSMKRRNSHLAGASGVCVTFPGSPLMEATAVMDRYMGLRLIRSRQHLISSTVCPSRFPQGAPDPSVKVLLLQNLPLCDGEKELRGCSGLQSCKKTTWGRCSLQFSKVLEDQDFLAHSSDRDEALHFGFSFCLSTCPTLLAPSLVLPRLTSQINYLDHNLVPGSNFILTHAKKYNI